MEHLSKIARATGQSIWRAAGSVDDTLGRLRVLVQTAGLLLGGVVLIMVAFGVLDALFFLVGVVAIAVAVVLLARNRTQDKPREGARLTLEELTLQTLARDFRRGQSLLRTIRWEARDSIKDLQRLAYLPEGEELEQLKEDIDERWRKQQESCDLWISRVTKRVRSSYGNVEAVLFESDAGIPPVDEPDFDATTAGIEAGLYRDVQRRLFRLHNILEKHGGV